MEPEQTRVQDARAWLSKAKRDLIAADHDLSAPERDLWGDVTFHAQQAAEKALKALLALHDVPFRKTHNIEELGRQCVAIEATLSGLIDRAAPLTEFAWKFRYPGEIEEPTPAEAMEALAAARQIYNAVSALVPEALRP